MQQSVSRHKFCKLRHKIQVGQRSYVAAKASQNLRLKRAFKVATIKFSVTTELEEDFEESCRDNPEICRDIQGGKW